MRTARAIAVAAIIGITSVAPAQATTTYEYWSYWQGDSGAWNYSSVGPAISPVKDGAVDGWRFGLGTNEKASAPALAPDFESVCGQTVAAAGQVRVAIFIDFGVAATPPQSECAVVTEGLSRASALSAIADLRTNNGFICAINGFPTSGCAGTATKTTTTPTKSNHEESSPLPTIVTVILAGITMALALRNARIQRNQS